LAGAIWSFFLALQIERPDLIAFLPQQNQLVIDALFFAVGFIFTVNISRFEISDKQLSFVGAFKLVMRNLVVIGLGLGMLVFISRELLHGIDPTGRIKIWNGAAPVTPAPLNRLPQPSGKDAH
jgi:hypothetical protein